MNWRFRFGRMLNDPVIGRCFYSKPFQHLVIIGASGKGKTSLIQRLISELPGGIIVLDPTGDLIDKVSSDFIHVDPDNPISINPLSRTYLDKAQIANEFAEILEVAVKTTSKDQMGSSVLMQKIFRNAIRVGVDDFEDLKSLLERDDIRKRLAEKTGDYYWSHFDDTFRPGNFKDREAVDSAKRIAARLSVITDDSRALKFFKGPPEFSVKDTADSAKKYIFNLHGFDSFIVSLIGGTIASLLKSYYRLQAQPGAPPIFFVCDEIQYFLTEHFYRFFVDCRRYNISINISLHTKSQLDDRIAKFLDDTVHTKVLMRENFEADVFIGDEKKYRVKLYPPLPATPLPVKHAKPENTLNFLKDDWM